MLKALGIKKKKPPSDSLIEAHKEQVRIHDDLEPDYQALQAIVKDLDNAYMLAKGDFMVGRYEELKNMLKHTIELYKERGQKKQERLVNRYQAKHGANATAVASLRDNARGFASMQTQLCEQEKKYSEYSAKQLEADLDVIKQENRQMRMDIRKLSDKLDRLPKLYEDSKKQNPTKRYDILKEIIKSTVR